MTRLPDDAIAAISQYLQPSDFYNLKTALSNGRTSRERDDMNRLYWWRHELTLERAVSADCPSLTRWVTREDTGLTVPEVLATARGARSFPVQVAIFDAMIARWGNSSDLASVWIETGSSRAFADIAKRASCDITVDTFDQLYLYSRWLMLATAFQFAPRQFIRWTFGDYMRAADPEVIQNLRFAIHHLDPYNRAALVSLLTRYHGWLWRDKLDDAATINTIAALHQLEVAGHRVIAFVANDYLHLAISTPHPEFLEYLLMSGLEVSPELFKLTRNLDKLRMLAAAQVVQKFQQIMVMMIILIAAVVTGIFMGHTPAKIQKLKSHSDKQDEYDSPILRT